MNSLILLADECISKNKAVLSGHRLARFRIKHELKVGDDITVGVLSSNTVPANEPSRGKARLLTLSSEHAEFELELNQSALIRSATNLIVAIARPQTVKKVIHLSCVLGINNLFFVRSSNSEKSYLSSSVLQADQIQEQVITALEQACDNIAPNIEICPFFQPFIDQQISSFELGSAYLAEPSGQALNNTNQRNTREFLSLAIGPESGWSDYERAQFIESGFTEFSLGRRIMRVEEACAYALGMLSNLVRLNN